MKLCFTVEWDKGGRNGEVEGGEDGREGRGRGCWGFLIYKLGWGGGGR